MAEEKKAPKTKTEFAAYAKAMDDANANVIKNKPTGTAKGQKINTAKKTERKRVSK